MPGAAGIESVHVEAAFTCNSTLLLVSLPMAVWTYLPDDPAIIPLGRVFSSNLMAARGVPQEKAAAVEEPLGNDKDSKISVKEEVESYPTSSWWSFPWVNSGCQTLLGRPVQEKYPLCGQCNTRIMSVEELAKHKKNTHLKCPRCPESSPSFDSKSALDYVKHFHSTVALDEHIKSEYTSSIQPDPEQKVETPKPNTTQS
jgi:hypothetical protein